MTSKMRLRLSILLIFQLPGIFIGAQQYWALTGSIHSVLYSIDLDCNVQSELEWLVTADFVQYGSSMTPNGNLYGLSSDILLINTTNGNATVAVDLPNTGSSQPGIQGLVCVSNTICYSIDRVGAADTLVEINLVTGTITPVAPLEGKVHLSDLGLFNGDLYYENDGFFTDSKLTRIRLTNPIVQEVVMDLPDDIYFYPMTATRQCHTLLSKTGVGDMHVLINMLDGDISFIEGNPYWNFGITGMVEFETPACVSSVDLDCNDSSGADGRDYQSPDYYCITEDGVPVCDQDIIFLYDTLIDYVTIELTGAPDGNLEYLTAGQSYPGLDITGSGTQMIRIENEGMAPSTIFKQAMRSIRYFNDAYILTLGTRVIRVNGQTYYNTDLDEGLAFVDVAQYPVYEFDLGPDTTVCDGNFVVLNAMLPNLFYDWSTGASSQTIQVTEAGKYYVTVSGSEFCPNTDSIEVSFTPSVTVGLANTPIGCAGEEQTFVVEVESDIPVTITILSLPGDTIVLTDVSDDTEVPLFINANTYFEILSVTSSQEMCLTIDNSYMDYNVLPVYMDTLIVGICEGDSVFIKPGVFAYQPGYYTAVDNTQYGCDSITTYNVFFNQSIDVFIESTTCIAADTGLFVQFISNPNGCDTNLTKHIILGPPDTTFVNGVACRTGNEGVFTENLMSIDGCDSVVVTDLSLMAPQDTSWSYQTSCDLNLIGTFYSIHANQAGCDSLAILMVSPGAPDTTHVFATSCIPAEIGVFEMLLQNQYLCDSLVIVTVTMSTDPDTTLSFRTSCDSSFLGVHEILLTNSKGCDSLVIETVTYAEKDTTQLTAYTCDPGEAGHTISTFTNQFGCDSIVVEDVILNPSYFQTIHTGSCFEPDTGTFTQHFVNQFGCDSVITTIVAYYPSQNELIIEATCHVADTGTFIHPYQNQFGCDSIITRIVNYSPVDTTIVFKNTCVESEAGVFEEWLTTQDGCDSLIRTTVEYDPADISIQALSNFNGYPLRCADTADGEIEAMAEGHSPFTFKWSTLSTDSILTGLSEGHYSVTVTDANSCQSIADFELEGPPAIDLGVIVTDPDCFATRMGTVTAEASGGIMPYRFSMDGTSFQSSPVFEHLPGGMYQLMVVDANQCTASEVLLINQPLPVDVDLGDDLSLVFGDTGVLVAIVNVPVDILSQITWNGIDTLDCPDCLSQIVAPFITSGYSIQVITDEGCADSDSVTIVITPGTTFYIPNIFSPNDDGVNDVFSFIAGKAVTRIASMRIFDRWGGVMFSAEDLMPGDPSLYWDGKAKGQPCNPGVYVYQLVAVLVNSEKIVRSGNVTLMR